MATDLQVATREMWDRALNDGRLISIPELAQQVMEAHGDLVRSEYERRALQSICNDLKDLARIEADQSGQLNFLGFPAVIAVPFPSEGYRYMQATKACWDELCAGRLIRENNVQRAQAKLDAYDAALFQVRPAMEGTDLTLAQALVKMQPADADTEPPM